MLNGKLICLDKNGDPCKAIEAKGRKFSIGYLMNCDHILADNDEAEKVHCQIECDAFGHVTIYNKSEKNPIKVNDEIVVMKRTLFNNSKIRILDKEFLWQQKKTTSNVDVETVNCKDVSTPIKQIGIPEQPPSSCPAFRHHRDLPKRFTVHNFRTYRVDNDEYATIEDHESTDTKDTSCPSVNTAVIDSQTSTSAYDTTPAKIDLVDSTTDKKTSSTEKRLKVFRSVCGWSGMTATSYSPRETGVRIEKTFTAIIPPKTPNSSVCRTPKGLLERLHLHAEGQNNSNAEVSFSTPTKKSNCHNGKGIIVQHPKSAMKVVDLTTFSKLHSESSLSRSMSHKKLTASKSLLSFSDKNVSRDSIGVTALAATPKIYLDETSASSASVIIVESSGASDLSGAGTDSSLVSSTTPLCAQLPVSSVLRKQALLTSAKKQAATSKISLQHSPKTPVNTPLTLKIRPSASTHIAHLGTSKVQTPRDIFVTKNKNPVIRKLDVSTTKPFDSPVTKNNKMITSTNDTKTNNILNANTLSALVRTGEENTSPVTPIDSTSLATSTPYKAQVSEKQCKYTEVEVEAELLSALHNSNEVESSLSREGTKRHEEEKIIDSKPISDEHSEKRTIGENDDLMKKIEEILNTSDELKRQLQTTVIKEEEDHRIGEAAVTEEKLPTSLSSPTSTDAQGNINTSPSRNSLTASILLKAINSLEKNKPKTSKEDEEKENKINETVTTPARRRISLSGTVSSSNFTTPAPTEEILIGTVTPLTPKRVTKRRPSILLENDEVATTNTTKCIVETQITENMEAIIEEEGSYAPTEQSEDKLCQIVNPDFKFSDTNLETIITTETSEVVGEKNTNFIEKPLLNDGQVNAQEKMSSMSPLHCLDESFAEPVTSEKKDQSESMCEKTNQLENESKTTKISSVNEKDVAIELIGQQPVEMLMLKESEFPIVDESFGEIDHTSLNDDNICEEGMILSLKGLENKNQSEARIVNKDNTTKNIVRYNNENDEENTVDESFGQIEVSSSKEKIVKETQEAGVKKIEDNDDVIEVLDSSLETSFKESNKRTKTPPIENFTNKKSEHKKIPTEIEQSKSRVIETLDTIKVINKGKVNKDAIEIFDSSLETSLIECNDITEVPPKETLPERKNEVQPDPREKEQAKSYKIKKLRHILDSPQLFEVESENEIKNVESLSTDLNIDERSPIGHMLNKTFEINELSTVENEIAVIKEISQTIENEEIGELPIALEQQKVNTEAPEFPTKNEIIRTIEGTVEKLALNELNDDLKTNEEGPPIVGDAVTSDEYTKYTEASNEIDKCLGEEDALSHTSDIRSNKTQDLPHKTNLESINAEFELNSDEMQSLSSCHNFMNQEITEEKIEESFPEAIDISTVCEIKEVIPEKREAKTTDETDRLVKETLLNQEIACDIVEHSKNLVLEKLIDESHKVASSSSNDEHCVEPIESKKSTLLNKTVMEEKTDDIISEQLEDKSKKVKGDSDLKENETIELSDEITYQLIKKSDSEVVTIAEQGKDLVLEKLVAKSNKVPDISGSPNEKQTKNYIEPKEAAPLSQTVQLSDEKTNKFIEETLSTSVEENDVDPFVEEAVSYEEQVLNSIEQVSNVFEKLPSISNKTADDNDISDKVSAESIEPKKSVSPSGNVELASEKMDQSVKEAISNEEPKSATEEESNDIVLEKLEDQSNKVAGSDLSDKASAEKTYNLTDKKINQSFKETLTNNELESVIEERSTDMVLEELENQSNKIADNGPSIKMSSESIEPKKSAFPSENVELASEKIDQSVKEAISNEEPKSPTGEQSNDIVLEKLEDQSNKVADSDISDKVSAEKTFEITDKEMNQSFKETTNNELESVIEERSNDMLLEELENQSIKVEDNGSCDKVSSELIEPRKSAFPSENVELAKEEMDQSVKEAISNEEPKSPTGEQSNDIVLEKIEDQSNKVADSDLSDKVSAEKTFDLTDKKMNQSFKETLTNNELESVIEERSNDMLLEELENQPNKVGDNDRVSSESIKPKKSASPNKTVEFADEEKNQSFKETITNEELASDIQEESNDKVLEILKEHQTIKFADSCESDEQSVDSSKSKEAIVLNKTVDLSDVKTKELVAEMAVQGSSLLLVDSTFYRKFIPSEENSTDVEIRSFNKEVKDEKLMEIKTPLFESFAKTDLEEETLETESKSKENITGEMNTSTGNANEKQKENITSKAADTVELNYHAIQIVALEETKESQQLKICEEEAEKASEEEIRNIQSVESDDVETIKEFEKDIECNTTLNKTNTEETKYCEVLIDDLPEASFKYVEMFQQTSMISTYTSNIHLNDGLEINDQEQCNENIEETNDKATEIFPGENKISLQEEKKLINQKKMEEIAEAAKDIAEDKMDLSSKIAINDQAVQSDRLELEIQSMTTEYTSNKEDEKLEVDQENEIKSMGVSTSTSNSAKEVIKDSLIAELLQPELEKDNTTEPVTGVDKLTTFVPDETDKSKVLGKFDVVVRNHHYTSTMPLLQIETENEENTITKRSNEEILECYPIDLEQNQASSSKYKMDDEQSKANKIAKPVNEKVLQEPLEVIKESQVTIENYEAVKQDPNKTGIDIEKPLCIRLAQATSTKPDTDDEQSKSNKVDQVSKAEAIEEPSADDFLKYENTLKDKPKPIKEEKKEPKLRRGRLARVESGKCDTSDEKSKTNDLNQISRNEVVLETAAVESEHHAVQAVQEDHATIENVEEDKQKSSKIETKMHKPRRGSQARADLTKTEKDVENSKVNDHLKTNDYKISEISVEKEKEYHVLDETQEVHRKIEANKKSKMAFSKAEIKSKKPRRGKQYQADSTEHDTDDEQPISNKPDQTEDKSVLGEQGAVEKASLTLEVIQEAQRTESSGVDKDQLMESSIKDKRPRRGRPTRFASTKTSTDDEKTVTNEPVEVNDNEVLEVPIEKERSHNTLDVIQEVHSEIEISETPIKACIKTETKSQKLRRGKKIQADSRLPDVNDEETKANKEGNKTLLEENATVEEEHSYTLEVITETQDRAKNKKTAKLESSNSDIKDQKSRRGKQARTASTKTKTEDKDFTINCQEDKKEISEDKTEIIVDVTVNKDDIKKEQDLITLTESQTENLINVSTTRNLRRRAAVQNYEISSDSEDEAHHATHRKRRTAKNTQKQLQATPGIADTANTSKASAKRAPRKKQLTETKEQEQDESKEHNTPGKKKRARKNAEPKASSTLLNNSLLEMETTHEKVHSLEDEESLPVLNKGKKAATGRSRARGPTSTTKHDDHGTAAENEDEAKSTTLQKAENLDEESKPKKVTKRGTKATKPASTRKRKDTNQDKNENLESLDSNQSLTRRAIKSEEELHLVEIKTGEIPEEKPIVDVKPQPKSVSKRRGKLTKVEESSQENETITTADEIELPTKRSRRQSVQSEKHEEVIKSSPTVTSISVGKRGGVRRGKQLNETKLITETDTDDKEATTEIKNIFENDEYAKDVIAKTTRGGRRGRRIDTTEMVIPEKKQKPLKASIYESDEVNMNVQTPPELQKPTQPTVNAANKSTRAHRANRSDSTELLETASKTRRKQTKAQSIPEADNIDSIAEEEANIKSELTATNMEEAAPKKPRGRRQKSAEPLDVSENPKTSRSQRRKHVHFNEEQTVAIELEHVETNISTTDKMEDEVPKKRRKR